MAAASDTGNEVYWSDGEPVPAMDLENAGGEVYWFDGEPEPGLYPAGAPLPAWVPIVICA